jgi:hypothetical protein
LDLQYNRLSLLDVFDVQGGFFGSNTSVFITVDNFQIPTHSPVYDNTDLVSQVESIKTLAKEKGLYKEWFPSEVWEELNKPENNSFKMFLDKIWETRDGSQHQKLLLQTILNIFDKMEENTDFAKHCMLIADESVNSCVDRVAMGLIQMQLAKNAYPSHTISLQELHLVERAMTKADALFAFARQKVETMTGIIDEIETYLKYCKEFKQELGITTEDMMFEGLSNVTSKDLQEATKVIEGIPEDTIYERVLDHPIVRERYIKSLQEIQNQDRFDTLPKEDESDIQYKDRIQKIQRDLKTEKVNWLKQRLQEEQKDSKVNKDA